MPTTTLVTFKDSFIRADQPDDNYGADNWLYLSDSAVNARRIVTSFSLATINPAWHIRSATLGLRYWSVFEPGLPAAGRITRAHALTRNNWVEGTGTFAAPTVDGVTWNRYKPLYAWLTAGGDYTLSAPVGGSCVVPAVTPEWMDFDVLAIVLDAIHRSDPLYKEELVNFLVKFEDETQNGDAVRLQIRGIESGASPPRLVIEYDDVISSNETTVISETQGTLNGEVVDDEAETVDYVGFVWDTKSLPKPRDVHPAANVNEDLTGFVEVDPNNRITVVADRVSYNGLTRNEAAHVYRECDIDGDFSIWFDARLISGDGQSWVLICSLQSQVEDYSGVQDCINVFHYFSLAGDSLVILDIVQGGVYSRTSQAITPDTTYYYHLWRDRYSEVYLDVYSSSALREAGGEGDVGRRTRTLNTRIPFSYLFAINTFDTGSALAQTGWAENYQIKHYRNYHLDGPGDYGINPFSHTLTGLTSNLVYFTRAVFHNANGWYYGNEERFGARAMHMHWAQCHKVSTGHLGLYTGTNPSIVHFVGGGRRRTFIAYQTDVTIRRSFFANDIGKGAFPHIAYFDWDDERWYGPFYVADNPIEGDPHSGAAIFIDGNNHLHVFWGSHGAAPNGNQHWTRSTRTLDVAEPFTGVGDFETHKTFGDWVTYPQVVGVVGGELVLFIRGETVGVTHSEREGWWRSNNYDGAWGVASFTKLWHFIDSGDWNLATVYMLTTPVIDAFGNIHVAWRWYNEITHTPYNTLYARYNAAGGYWEKADGTPYTDDGTPAGVPIAITLATAEVVTSTEWMEGGERIGADETGRPYVAPSTGTTTLYVWEAPNWVERTAPENIHALEVISSTLLYIYCRGWSAGKWQVLRYTSTDRGATFGDKILISEFTGVITMRALCQASGGLPSTLGLVHYQYTNPVPDGDSAYDGHYTVGNIWMAGGMPYSPIQDIWCWNGAAWAIPPSIRRWDGAAWQNVRTVRRWDGANWVTIWEPDYP